MAHGVVVQAALGAIRIGQTRIHPIATPLDDIKRIDVSYLMAIDHPAYYDEHDPRGRAAFVRARAVHDVALLIDAIGEVLERQGHTERNRRVFLWGVSELCQLSRPDCPMRALALSHLRQARDHYRSLAPNLPSGSTHKQLHYAFVAASARRSPSAGRSRA
jgi:hypothetical protein